MLQQVYHSNSNPKRVKLITNIDEFDVPNYIQLTQTVYDGQNNRDNNGIIGDQFFQYSIEFPDNNVLNDKLNNIKNIKNSIELHSGNSICSLSKDYLFQKTYIIEISNNDIMSDQYGMLTFMPLVFINGLKYKSNRFATLKSRTVGKTFVIIDKNDITINNDAIISVILEFTAVNTKNSINECITDLKRTSVTKENNFFNNESLKNIVEPALLELLNTRIHYFNELSLNKYVRFYIKTSDNIFHEMSTPFINLLYTTFSDINSISATEWYLIKKDNKNIDIYKRRYNALMDKTNVPLDIRKDREFSIYNYIWLNSNIINNIYYYDARELPKYIYTTTADNNLYVFKPSDILIFAYNSTDINLGKILIPGVDYHFMVDNIDSYRYAIKFNIETETNIEVIYRHNINYTNTFTIKFTGTDKNVLLNLNKDLKENNIYLSNTDFGKHIIPLFNSGKLLTYRYDNSIINLTLNNSQYLFGVYELDEGLGKSNIESNIESTTYEGIKLFTENTQNLTAIGDSYRIFNDMSLIVYDTANDSNSILTENNPNNETRRNSATKIFGRSLNVFYMSYVPYDGNNKNTFDNLIENEIYYKSNKNNILIAPKLDNNANNEANEKILNTIIDTKQASYKDKYENLNTYNESYTEKINIINKNLYAINLYNNLYKLSELYGSDVINPITEKTNNCYVISIPNHIDYESNNTENCNSFNTNNKKIILSDKSIIDASYINTINKDYIFKKYGFKTEQTFLFTSLNEYTAYKIITTDSKYIPIVYIQYGGALPIEIVPYKVVNTNNVYMFLSPKSYRNNNSRGVSLIFITQTNNYESFDANINVYGCF